MDEWRIVLTSSGTLVVKENSVTREHIVGFSVVDADPVGIKLGTTWRKSKSINIISNIQPGLARV